MPNRASAPRFQVTRDVHGMARPIPDPFRNGLRPLRPARPHPAGTSSSTGYFHCRRL